MNREDIIKDCDGRMQKSIDTLVDAFKKMRTGRAHVAILDSIRVEHYGNQVPLMQVASIVAEDARTLTVTVWEKDMISITEKAIMASDLGITPVTHGQVLRLPMPPLTADRRQDLIKAARQTSERARISVRNNRRDLLQDLKKNLKDKIISEDDAKRIEQALQKSTDRFVAMIDQKLQEKEKDLLVV
jgi:ribosome recycling factor